MTFSYNANIPAANDPPTNDQPGMQTNAASISSIIAVDHVGFNTSGGGQHNQVTFATTNPPMSAPTGLTSIEYTAAGTAKSASPQLFWQNQDAAFHFPIHAWGFLGAGATTTLQGYNINSIVKNSVGVYTVTLTTGAIQSNSFGIIATSAQESSAQTCITAAPTGTGTFKAFITTLAGTPVDAAWSFTVLQI